MRFLLILSFFVTIQADSSDLIVNYFTNVKKVHEVVFVSCNFDEYFIHDLQKEASKKFLKTQLVEIDSKEEISLKSSAIIGIYLNLTCNGSESFMEKSFFNTSYSWLIEGFQFPNQLNSLRIDSDVKLLTKNSEGYELTDLFNIGTNLQSISYGNWTEKLGFYLIDSKNRFQISFRRDFKGTLFKTGLYTKLSESENVTLIQKVLTETRSSFDTVLQLKYFNGINDLLIDVLNFRIEFDQITHELGDLTSKSGLYSMLTTRKCDIISSGAYISNADDTTLMEFIYSRFWLDHGLYYLLTSEFMRKKDLLTFFTPLAKDVWIVFIFFVFLISMMFKTSYFYLGKYQKKSEDEEEEKGEPSIFINIFEIITNQGVNDMPEQASLRLVILSGLILMLVLFNLYSASLLTVILMPPMDPYRHANELIASDIQLSRYDESYAKFSLQRNMNESLQKYQEVMMTDNKTTNNHLRKVLVFSDGLEGVLNLRDGLHAFGGESSAIEYVAGYSFKLSEICNLKRQTLINIPMFTVLPKGSQYKEIFKIVLLQATEAGILDKILKLYKKNKGLCLVGVSLNSVTFSKVRSAFYILGGGSIVSLILLIIEILWNKFHKDIYEIFRKLANNELEEGTSPRQQVQPKPMLGDYYYMP